jgi:hypothetical protein
MSQVHEQAAPESVYIGKEVITDLVKHKSKNSIMVNNINSI